MIDQIDDILRHEGVVFDSSIISKEPGKIWFFNEGLLVAEVNIVSAPLSVDSDVQMDVLVDSKYVTSANAGSDVKFSGSRAFVKVNEKRLYNVFKGDYGEHRLDLKVSKGFSFNAFTFG